MIILGIDPGTNITGYGIIKYENNAFTKIDSGVINLPSHKIIPERLKIIYQEISETIKRYLPDEFAIETAFYGKNVQSAMKIGYARGVAILAAVLNDIPTSEYSPREVKKAVVGRGSATKEQVSYMIKSILNIDEDMKVDETDALAIAICHTLRMKSSTRQKMSWKKFVETFPERVIND
ncbi:MAG: crossover junction endodeoxyribonuclease RuvC [Ignavibacteria bacterium]|jgi:crossover junction endodeoxyribonuclease RuvC